MPPVPTVWAVFAPLPPPVRMRLMRRRPLRMWIPSVSFRFPDICQLPQWVFKRVTRGRKMSPFPPLHIWRLPLRPLWLRDHKGRLKVINSITLRPATNAAKSWSPSTGVAPALRAKRKTRSRKAPWPERTDPSAAWVLTDCGFHGSKTYRIHPLSRAPGWYYSNQARGQVIQLIMKPTPLFPCSRVRL